MTQKQKNKALKKNTIQERYDKLSDEVNNGNNIREIEKIFRQNSRKDMQLK